MFTHIPFKYLFPLYEVAGETETDVIPCCPLAPLSHTLVCYQLQDFWKPRLWLQKVLPLHPVWQYIQYLQLSYKTIMAKCCSTVPCSHLFSPPNVTEFFSFKTPTLDSALGQEIFRCSSALDCQLIKDPFQILIGWCFSVTHFHYNTCSPQGVIYQDPASFQVTQAWLTVIRKMPPETIQDPIMFSPASGNQEWLLCSPLDLEGKIWFSCLSAFWVRTVLFLMRIPLSVVSEWLGPWSRRLLWFTLLMFHGPFPKFCHLFYPIYLHNLCLSPCLGFNSSLHEWLDLC